MNWEYLGFNILILSTSLLGALIHPRAQRVDFKAALQAIGLIGLLFIGFDFLVTNWFWSFNPQFVLGWRVGSVPIEEILFFLTVPWACVILWVNSKNLLKGSDNLTLLGKGIRLMCLVLAGWAVWTRAWYTLSVSTVSFLLSLGINWRQLPRRYWIFGVVTLCLTAIFNTYLTARPVVMYNPAIMTNLRLGTIPIEDFFYGLILVLGVVWSYEALKKRNADLRTDTPSTPESL